MPSIGGPCHQLNETAELWAFTSQNIVHAHRPPTTLAQHDSLAATPILRELELWYSATADDYFALASNASKAAAKAAGYVKERSLGWIWPPPGSPDAPARYPLPAITKDDPSYLEQS